MLFLQKQYRPIGMIAERKRMVGQVEERTKFKEAKDDFKFWGL